MTHEQYDFKIGDKVRLKERRDINGSIIDKNGGDLTGIIKGTIARYFDYEIELDSPQTWADSCNGTTKMHYGVYVDKENIELILVNRIKMTKL